MTFGTAPLNDIFRCQAIAKFCKINLIQYLLGGTVFLL